MRDTFKYGHLSGQLRMLNCNVLSAAQQCGAGAIFLWPHLVTPAIQLVWFLYAVLSRGDWRERKIWRDVCGCVIVGKNSCLNEHKKSLLFSPITLLSKLFYDTLKDFYFTNSFSSCYSWCFIRNSESESKNKQLQRWWIFTYMYYLFRFMRISLSLKYFATEINEFWWSVMGLLLLT